MSEESSGGLAKKQSSVHLRTSGHTHRVDFVMSLHPLMQQMVYFVVKTEKNTHTRFLTSKLELLCFKLSLF